MPHPLDVGNSNDAPFRPTRAADSRKRNSTFQVMPKYSLANIDTLGLKRSSRISSLKRKQLDPTLNHVDFDHVTNASDEDIDPLKQHCAFKEVMKIPCKEKCSSAMIKEINNHTNHKYWKYCRKSEVPLYLILRSTWTFHIKRNRSTEEIIKFKARFCVDVRTQEVGINFNETCATVVKWNTTRAYVTMSTLNNWHAKAIDFDQASTKADCDADVCLYLLDSFHIKNKDRCIIKLIKKLYVLRQGGHNFYEKLKSELENRGCVQSAANPCTFHKKNAIIFYCVDGCLLFAQTSELSDELFASLKEYFLCADKGEVDGHLGLKIKTTDDALTLKKPQLIKRTIDLFGLTDSNPRSIPVAKPLIGKNADGKDKEGDSFHHRLDVGTFQCLDGFKRPDTSMANHQVDKFYTNPKSFHDAETKIIGDHLLSTRDEGLMHTPNEDKGLEAFTDANFLANLIK